jgi:putative oxidoreductase
MLTAVAVAHWKNGFFTQNGGYEYPLLLAMVALAIACSGPGGWSLDHLAGWSLAGAAWGAGAFVLAAVSSAAVVGTRSLRLQHSTGREVTA